MGGRISSKTRRAASHLLSHTPDEEAFPLSTSPKRASDPLRSWWAKLVADVLQTMQDVTHSATHGTPRPWSNRERELIRLPSSSVGTICCAPSWKERPMVENVRFPALGQSHRTGRGVVSFGLHVLGGRDRGS